MESRLQAAIALRKAGEHEQSREALKVLADEPALRAQALLNIAWSFDNQGRERDAEGYYLAAIEAGLSDEYEFEARFGLASTWRCLGKYPQAKVLFAEIIARWPLAAGKRSAALLCALPA